MNSVLYPVTREKDILPALKEEPGALAVAFKRPDMTTFLLELAHNTKIEFDPISRQSVLVTPEEKLTKRFNTHLKAILDDDIFAVQSLHYDVHEAYTGFIPKGENLLNIIPIGKTGRVPYFHRDTSDVNAHVSYFFATLQYLTRIPSETLWQRLVENDFKDDSCVPEDMIGETEIGDIVFMKGQDAAPKDVQKERVFMHRSSNKIPELGQVSVVIS